MFRGMVLAGGPSWTLGGRAGARLKFSEAAKPEGGWAGKRLLLLDDRPAFELSFWCGTCPFLFERLEGANETLSLSDVTNQLAEGLRDIDDEVVDKFAQLLPLGEYVPLLLQVQPRLVRPVEPGDYFSEEQVATWGIDSFWGLPEYPHTPYYRTFETSVDREAHLYEFVVPMVPPSWNDAAQVAAFAERLDSSSQPTAVAVTTLDVCAPAVEEGSDWYAHWGLSHFLLDGHHKFQAAADRDRPLRLLALVSVEGSLASAEQVGRIAELRSQPAAMRVPVV
jgi:hypothetical protein